MSSHNSVSDVDIYRHFFSPFLLSLMFWSRCVAPQSAFSFLCVSLFYPPVALRKIGITKSADRSLASKDRPRQAHQWLHGCTFVNAPFVNTLTAFLQNFTSEKRKRQKRIGNIIPVCVREQNPLTTQCLCARNTHTRADTNSRTLSQLHIPTQTLWTNCSIRQSFELKRTKKVLNELNGHRCALRKRVTSHLFFTPTKLSFN